MHIEVKSTMCILCKQCIYYVHHNFIKKIFKSQTKHCQNRNIKFHFVCDIWQDKLLYFHMPVNSEISYVYMSIFSTEYNEGGWSGKLFYWILFGNSPQDKFSV